MLLSRLRITPLLLNSKRQCHLTCSHQHGELSTPTSLQFLYTWFPGYQSLLVFFALLGPTYRFDSFSSPGGECHSIQFLDKFSKLWSWLSLSNGFKYHATTLKLKSSAQTFWTSGCIIQFSTSLVYLIAQNTQSTKLILDLPLPNLFLHKSINALLLFRPKTSKLFLSPLSHILPSLHSFQSRFSYTAFLVMSWTLTGNSAVHKSWHFFLSLPWTSVWFT